MKSQKLSYLLRLLWNNPIFGDSYPSSVYESETLRQIDDIHACFSTKFQPILAVGMPHSSAKELNEVLDQVAPKSIAFCTAISAGEIEDTQQLCAVAVAIAISYWADQGMDRGDEAMLAAVHHIGAEQRKNTRDTFPASGLVSASLAALRHIEHQVRQVNDHDEDLPYMLRAIYLDVLANQARMRELSRRYLTEGESNAFWDKYAEEAAQKLIADSGLMSAVTVIYAIFRRQQPEIPSLAEIYHHPELMKLVQGPFNSAIRVFDDLGDRHIDAGQHSQWGVFNINIFNQPNPKFLDTFIKHSGFEDDILHENLMTAFTDPNPANRMYVMQVYLDLLRKQVSGLPRPLWEKYGIFLSLCKRTLEAGLVNSIGDIILTENTEAGAIELDILKLITQGRPENLEINCNDYQGVNAL